MWPLEEQQQHLSGIRYRSKFSDPIPEMLSQFSTQRLGNFKGKNFLWHMVLEAGMFKSRAGEDLILIQFMNENGKADRCIQEGGRDRGTDCFIVSCFHEN